MYNNYNYLIPENHQAWRSASEIAMVALAHENRRVQFMDEDQTPAQQAAGETQKTGILSFLAAPLHLLASLMG